MTQELTTWLDRLAGMAQEDMESQNEVRDEALRQSRALIRICSHAIRAGHRGAWDEAAELLAQANATGAQMQRDLAAYPELYYAGYTQDALKELIEARVTLALIAPPGAPEDVGANMRALPDLDTLEIPLNTCLNGVCEAASELRRRCLDMLRHERYAEAERLLGAMDEAYEILMSFSFPDAITRGLRRRVDQLRGVLERTRGDLTSSLQMARLRHALVTAQEMLSPEAEGVTTDA